MEYDGSRSTCSHWTIQFFVSMETDIDGAIILFSTVPNENPFFAKFNNYDLHIPKDSRLSSSIEENKRKSMYICNSDRWVQQRMMSVWLSKIIWSNNGGAKVRRKRGKNELVPSIECYSSCLVYSRWDTKFCVLTGTDETAPSYSSQRCQITKTHINR